MAEGELQDMTSTTAVKEQSTPTAKAYAAKSAASGMAAASIQRREPKPTDVQIEILFCGVCHSDLHQVRNEWENMLPTVYPCVPGHEIVGRVMKTGSAVKKFKAGDLVGSRMHGGFRPHLSELPCGQ